ncbi:MAG TPA: PLDc N-terminal domain-containing protein [Chitinophagaceae bacterium]|jgi:hypothetical membrane protein
MKHVGWLLLVPVGVATFMIGAIPHYHHPVIGYILMGLAAMLIGAFYLHTLLEVLKSKNKRRITWLIIIVCAPLVGNLIYFFFHDAFTSPQVPEPGSN